MEDQELQAEAPAPRAGAQARDGVPSSPLLAAAGTAARERFGFPGLRAHQAQVLQHVLDDHDCLAVLPTGSGKSLCYALPALVRPGLVLVISPLIALIRDQARKFADHGIACASLDSLQSGLEKESVWHRIETGELQILLVSPERLARVDFRERLRSLPLQLVAIDEAHCISHWGSHFRPDYRFLGEYLEDLGQVQKLAVTATATAKVRDDIVRTLRLTAPATVWADFARENLSIKVAKASRVPEQLTAILQAVLSSPGSGIVYAPTRKNAREVHRMLTDAGVEAALYHAGMAGFERNEAQREFMSGQARVVVATHAFGMGIDKADIRFVHPAGLPGCIEQYVQEIGRAGRDGLPASCTLVYGPRDYYIRKFMIDKSYPDPELLKAVLAHARDEIQGPYGVSLLALQKSLRTAVKGDEEEQLEALRMLCREGLLSHHRASGSGFDEEAEVMIGEGNPRIEAEVMAEYPLRKVDAMAKLDAMKAFVAEGASTRLGYLDRYFRA
jgi:ATP-dependent DNA helicase RecQ